MAEGPQPHRQGPRLQHLREPGVLQGHQLVAQVLKIVSLSDRFIPIGEVIGLKLYRVIIQVDPEVWVTS